MLFQCKSAFSLKCFYFFLPSFSLLDGLTVSCDIANEEELFMGQGDYQFEIYRLMKNENK